MKKILGLVVGLLFTLPAFATDLDTCRNLFDENSFYNAVGPSYEIFPTSNENGRTYFLRVKPNTKYTISFKTPGDRLAVYSLNKEVDPRDYSTAHPLELGPTLYNNNAPTSPTVFTTREDSKMVAIYYSLSERPTEFQIEEGSTTTAYEPYNAACWAIKVATKKYNDTAFSPVVTALNSAISTIKMVVTNTINQAAAVESLQNGKQTMPNASATNGTCPNYKQCLLVETSDGKPQWFVITDPFRDFVTPIVANNAQPAKSSDSGYTQLEYIESNGSQYIPTNITQTGAELDIDIKYMMLDGNGEYATILGNHQSLLLIRKKAATNDMSIFVNGSGNTNVRMVTWDGGAVVNQIKTIQVHANGSSFSVYGNGVLLESGTGARDNMNEPLNLYLFSSFLTNSGVVYPAKAKLYYVKISAGGTLVRDMVPVRQNLTGKYGMYDKVNNVFYPNAASSGNDFTPGPEVLDQDPAIPGMTWTATWTANANGVAAGTMNGVARCTSVAGANGYGTGTSSNATFLTELSSANQTAWNTPFTVSTFDNYNQCWCKANNIVIGNNTTPVPSSVSWMYFAQRTSAVECATNCAGRCAAAMQEGSGWRQRIFNTGS